MRARVRWGWRRASDATNVRTRLQSRDRLSPRGGRTDQGSRIHRSNRRGSRRRHESAVRPSHAPKSSSRRRALIRISASGERISAVWRQRRRSLEKMRSGRRARKRVRSRVTSRRPWGESGVLRWPAYRRARPRTDSPWRTRIREAGIREGRSTREPAPGQLDSGGRRALGPERRRFGVLAGLLASGSHGPRLPRTVPSGFGSTASGYSGGHRPRFSRGSLLGPRGHHSRPQSYRSRPGCQGVMIFRQILNPIRRV